MPTLTLTPSHACPLPTTHVRNGAISPSYIASSIMTTTPTTETKAISALACTGPARRSPSTARGHRPTRPASSTEPSFMCHRLPSHAPRWSFSWPPLSICHQMALLAGPLFSTRQTSPLAMSGPCAVLCIPNSIRLHCTACTNLTEQQLLTTRSHSYFTTSFLYKKKRKNNFVKNSNHACETIPPVTQSLHSA